MKASNDLGRDPIIGLVARLAVVLVAQVVNVLYSIIDRMFIRRCPEIGGVALAGVWGMRPHRHPAVLLWDSHRPGRVDSHGHADGGQGDGGGSTANGQ